MRGDLVQKAAADVCRELAAQGASGILAIDGPKGPGRVVFLDGDIIAAVSPTPRARLGDRLVGAGELAPEDLAEALALQDAQPLPLGSLLVERGMVRRDAVRVFVQEQILDALFEIIRWRYGAYAFTPDDIARDQGVPLALVVDDALVEVSRRQQEWRELSQVIPDMSSVPSFRAGAATANAALEPDEFAVLASVDGERTVRDLAATLGYGEFEAARIIYGLNLLGIVDVRPPQDEIGAALEDALAGGGLEQAYPSTLDRSAEVDVEVPDTATTDAEPPVTEGIEAASPVTDTADAEPTETEAGDTETTDLEQVQAGTAEQVQVDTAELDEEPTTETPQEHASDEVATGSAPQRTRTDDDLDDLADLDRMANAIFDEMAKPAEAEETGTEVAPEATAQPEVTSPPSTEPEITSEPPAEPEIMEESTDAADLDASLTPEPSTEGTPADLDPAAEQQSGDDPQAAEPEPQAGAEPQADEPSADGAAEPDDETRPDEEAPPDDEPRVEREEPSVKTTTPLAERDATPPSPPDPDPATQPDPDPATQPDPDPATLPDPATEPLAEPREPVRLGDDADVSEFLRELSRLSVDSPTETGQRSAATQTQTPPSSPRDGGKTETAKPDPKPRRRRGLFGRG